jgi:hypothetical protein
VELGAAVLVVDDRDVRAELADVRGLELADLELDEDVAQLGDVEDYLVVIGAGLAMTCKNTLSVDGDDANDVATGRGWVPGSCGIFADVMALI